MSSSPVKSPYGYVPTEWVGIAFVSLFAISTATHFVQVIYYRTWWLLATAFVCGLLEIGGWAARLWSSFSPTLLKPYIIQTTATIIGPTPLLATNFIILGRLIGRLGPQYSRLPPKIYSIIFTGCDIVALIVQGFGGVKASQAVANHEDPETGGHIMLGGIIFQMAAIVVYVILASEFLLRLFKNRPLKRSGRSASKPVEIESSAKQMIIGLVFMTTCIFLRSIYRTVELINGFTGVIITTQIYFILFDGALIVLAIYGLNVFHPGRLMSDIDAKHMPLSNSEEELPLEYRYDKWNVEQGSGSYDPYKPPSYNPYKAPYNP